MTTNHLISIILLAVIHLVSGVSAAGIDLAIGNMAIKLSPKNDAISYISVRNIVVSVFASAGPIAGGLMADYFSTHHLTWSIQWQGPSGISSFNLLALHNYSFFFVISSFLALLSISLVKRIKENGEANKQMVSLVMKKSVTRGFRKNMSSEAFKERLSHPLIVTGFKKRNKINKLWKDFKETA